VSGPPPTWGGLPDQNGNHRLPDLSWSMASEITERPIHWIDKPFLLDSTFHLLCGKKAVGKGLWLVNTVARMTRGELGEKTGVLWLSMSEDSYAVDLVPRLRAANAELSEVACLTNGHIRLPEQSELLAERIQPHIGLVVIDPLAGTLGAASANNDWEIRPMLQGLNQLADERQVIVVGIRHFSIKAGNGNEAIASVLGSTAWVDVPRMVLGVFRDDQEPDMRHLFVLAGNRTTPEPTGVVFHVGGIEMSGHEEPVPKASILGVSLKDPNELLSARGPRDDATKTEAAKSVILHILHEQPTQQMLCDVLDTLVAEETGLAVKTLRNLRTNMGSKGSGLIRMWRERPDDKTTPYWVGLTESGKLIAEGHLLSSPYMPLVPVKPEVPGSEGTNLQMGSLGSQGSLPSVPLVPEALPQLPPNAPEWEKRYWESREK